MSSHHEWEEAIQKQHDLSVPFSPENGTPLKFQVGDRVIYTNDYGVTFDRLVTGFHVKKGGLYYLGYRYYLNKDSFWMPVKESSLTIYSAPNL